MTSVPNRIIIASIALLAGCMVGPDYSRPTAPDAPAFKELAGWKPAHPIDAIDRGSWWSVYNDPVLDRLESQVSVNNQTVRQAEAAYRAASAEVGVARASLFPLIGLGAGATRQQTGISGLSTSSGLRGGSTTVTRSSFNIEPTASWDADVWGKIKRQVESSTAAAQVSAADLANALLSAQLSVATYYVELRGADAVQDLLRRTVAEYQRSLTIATNQYSAGTAARLDVLTAQTQLEGARAQLINAGVARAQYEHALAVLTGQPPSALSIPPGPLASDVPIPPAAIPSALLERRPDIAAAERVMAQQNALIGVQQAAYYPDVSLSALSGYAGTPLASLVQFSNRVWSLGAAANQTLFSFGARPAGVAAAEANYDAAVAAYRQSVLVAFQQVEDDLSTSRILQEQAAVQARAVQYAQQAVRIATNEYRAGTVAYTAVVIAQAAELADEQSELSVRVQRLQSSVGLIGALGGGWSTTDLVQAEQITDANPLSP